MKVTIASRAEEVFLSSTEAKILQQRILFLLLYLYQQGYTEFYTNCAWGVPLWSAELISRMKGNYPDILLHLALPHEKQAEKWIFSMKKHYLKIQNFADTIKYLSSPDDRQSFQKADRFMIQNSDLLLFYGTQGFLNYAPRYRETIIETYAKFQNIPVRYI
ncbi:MAG: DUF1273 domain-containing protein [Ruminococcus sp.]|nr:DUF1273 domain-containing protein [Ruminococcus sp.]